ncbi:hypothetical protein IKG28_02295 [Candidatus Saccharibacteria bacterium]|nr:hypothetical protein [Candidatus Saccharibacteria bacterium]
MIEISSIGRRRNNRRWQMLIGVFVAVFLFTFLVGRSGIKNEDVEAASLANFDPGYIISDYQMSNYNSMSEAEIQAFLTSKNSCPNRDYNYYQQLSAGSVATWHWENGHFVCLSEERFGDGETIGTGDTAAHIIWQTAQDFKINPKVILVLLQKETSLITDPIPNNYDYRKAVGYGCPDTAACSSTYYGFKNQVRNAAALFRTVLDGGWTNYPLGNNYIQYNPNAACGGSVVNVRSLATSALYRYTPYQPNAGAIAAGYGTAYCGAYGNRNFYLYFQDWFGGITDEGKEPEVLTKEKIMEENEKIASAGSDLELSYSAHVQNVGWLDDVEGGKVTGSSGHGLQMEAIKIKLGGEKTGIEYRTHIQDKGWEDSYRKDGETSGTAGQGLRLEAIQIRLSDELSKWYDISYRAHVQDIGWMGWVKNGEIAGTTGQSKRIEAIQIRIIRKNFDVSYRGHVQDIGWMNWMKNGEMAGTTGLSRRVEAIEIKLPDGLANKAEIVYRAHVQDIGWMGWVKNGATAGTTGLSRRVEAIEIKLDEETAKDFDVEYRVHAQDIGWMGWVKNGATAGTTGQSKRLEAIEIKLVNKN